MNETLALLYQKSLETLRDEYDVVVVGGGTAGIAAAVSASMQGALTLVLEKNSFLGGTATGGQTLPMMKALPKGGGQLVNKQTNQR